MGDVYNWWSAGGRTVGDPRGAMEYDVGEPSAMWAGTSMGMNMGAYADPNNMPMAMRTDNNFSGMSHTIPASIIY